MKIEEFKDYLVDKKDNVMDYLNSKKDSIKTGAKKAVATGLVVSTLLGGAAMTGCEDSNLTPEEKEYNQVLKDIDKQFKGKYSAVTICKDEITDKNIIVFAGDECQKGATFEITEDDFNRIKAAAISAQNENITINDNCIFFEKETLNNNIELRALVDGIYDSIEEKDDYQYEIEKEKYTVRYSRDLQSTIPNLTVEKLLNAIFLEKFPEGGKLDTIDEIEIFTHEEDFVEGVWEEDKDIAINFLDYIDYDGDGIADDVDVLHMGLWHHNIQGKGYIERVMEDMLSTLDNYVDGDKIRYEDGVYVLDPKVLDDSKYYLLNEFFKVIMNNMCYTGCKWVDGRTGETTIGNYKEFYKTIGRFYNQKEIEKEMIK